MVHAAEVYVILTAFTYDRADLTEALVEARGRGLEVLVAADRRMTLSGSTRDQLKSLKTLARGSRRRIQMQASLFASGAILSVRLCARLQ